MDGPGLYPSLTARQNLAALAALRGRDAAHGAAIDDVLDQVGLTDVADDRVRGFSLGMRQRLGLAAALLTKPRLLVLDEPSNGLDPAGKKHVHGVLTGLAADGTAVVLSSHRMDDLEALCSEVTILATGRVVFSGPLSKLAAENRELDYRLLTSDPRGRPPSWPPTRPGSRVVDDAGARHGAEVLVVRALVPALDELVVRLVQRGHRGARARPRGVAARGRVPGPHRAAGGRPMTATVAEPRPRRPAVPAARRVPVARGYRFELVKLLSQWRIRAAGARLLDRAGALRRRGEPAELAARRHPLRPLDARHRAGPDRWWCSASRAPGRCRC